MSAANTIFSFVLVATALTVYGIETNICLSSFHSVFPVATALTVYGIETIVKTVSLKNIWIC